MYAWGGNRLGQLGVGDRLSRSQPALVPLPFTEPVRRIVAGAYTSGVVGGKLKRGPTVETIGFQNMETAKRRV